MKSFQIENHTNLSALDFKTLSLLYQPLIGMDAYTIYHLLYQLTQRTQSKCYAYQFLLDILNIKWTPLKKAILKLEAMGLIDTYVKNELTLYIIKQPYTPKQFLTDTLLGSYLQSELGEEQTNMLIELFAEEKLDLSQFEFKTHDFEDVFEVKQLPLLHLEHPLQGEHGKGNLVLKTTFNMARFVDLLPDRYKTPALFTEKYEEALAKIQYVYQLDLEEMAKIYQEAYQHDTPTPEQIKFKANLYLNNRMPKIEESKTDDIALYDHISPKTIIQTYANEDTRVMALDTTFQLFERFPGVEKGVVNVLLMFILKRKSGVLPTVNYLDKVLKNWMMHGVQTTTDALKLVEQAEKQVSTTVYEKPKKNKYEAQWFDDFVKEIEDMEG